MNKDVVYNYSKGLCPVAENFYENELILSPLIREPLSINDIDDIVAAIKIVLENVKEIVAAFPNVDDSSIDYV